MLFRITEIDFDTDGDRKLAKKLAKEWVGKVFEAEDVEDADMNGADIISDESGWCINGFDFVAFKE
jgi:hypothetical protein